MSDATAGTVDERVLITRVFDAPREQVFNAWTDPDEVAAWYGPEHMDIPRETVRIDLRVGGRGELTMVQPWRRHGVRDQLRDPRAREPELIVMRSDPMPEAGMHEPTAVRVELQDHGDKTRMTLSDGPDPAAGRGHAMPATTPHRQARHPPQSIASCP